MRTQEPDGAREQADLDAFRARLLDLVRVRRHLGLRPAVEECDGLGAETSRLDRHVDRGVAAADHDDAVPDTRRVFRLDPLDEGEGVPDPIEVVAHDVGPRIRPHSDGEDDRVVRLREQLQACRADVPAEHDPSTQCADERGLAGERFAELAVRCDRVANEAACLLPLVVNRHCMAEGGELTGAGQAGGAGADDCNAEAGPRGATAKVPGLDEPDVGSVALEPPDLDRPSPLVREHAGALAEELCRADPRARAAEEVLGEDQLGGVRRVALRDRRHETGDVDVGGAGDRAGRGSVGNAAFEAAARLDARLVRSKRRLKLVEERRRHRCSSSSGLRERVARACASSCLTRSRVRPSSWPISFSV